ncbi:glycosyltransferase family 4 protein [Neobacillus sp. K501]
MGSKLEGVVNSKSSHCSGRRLKILMLCWEYPPNVVGGLSRHVFGLSVQLAEMGHEIHVLTAGNGSIPSFEIIKGVKVHRVLPLNYDDDFLTWIAGLNLAFAFKVEKLAEEVTFDIIHAHDWLVGSSAIILKEFLGIPLLTTIHATERGRHNGIHTEIQRFIDDKEKRLIAESDHLIVCSDFMREQLLRVFQVTAEKIAVIANGIEQIDSTVEPEELFPNLKNKKYVFSVGRMVKEKGFETLIEAAKIVKETEIDISFIIAGKGPMLERYRKIVTDEELDHYIAFIGYVTELERNSLLASCEMAVFPSLYEPFGIVALEAMILGRPTIVSNIGGLKGIVNHLQTGLLMIPGDANSLLDNIQWLLQNPENGMELGKKARQIVISLYGWKRIALETVHIIEDTLINKKAMANEE